MKMKKAAALLLLAASLGVSMPTNTVQATNGCTHWQTGTRPSETVLWARSQHKVYHNSYYGDYQEYSICDVEHYKYFNVKQCTRCSLVIRTEVPAGNYDVHSLADDKDHK